MVEHASIPGILILRNGSGVIFKCMENVSDVCRRKKKASFSKNTYL